MNGLLDLEHQGQAVSSVVDFVAESTEHFDKFLFQIRLKQTKAQMHACTFPPPPPPQPYPTQIAEARCGGGMWGYAAVASTASCRVSPPAVQ